MTRHLETIPYEDNSTTKMISAFSHLYLFFLSVPTDETIVQSVVTEVRLECFRTPENLIVLQNVEGFNHTIVPTFMIQVIYGV